MCRCTGLIVPDKKGACSGDKVHIDAKAGAVWALSAVKGKKDTYTVRTVSLIVQSTILIVFIIFLYYFFKVVHLLLEMSFFFPIDNQIIIQRISFNKNIYQKLFLFAVFSQGWLPQIPGCIT